MGRMGRETAASILTKLITVDGAGSGLDSDLVDGLTSTAIKGVDQTTLYLMGGISTTEGWLTPGETRGSGIGTYSSDFSKFYVPDAGTLERIVVWMISGGGTIINRIRIDVNGSTVHDSGVISIADGQRYAANISLAVSSGNYVEVRVTTSVGTGSCIAVISWKA